MSRGSFLVLLGILVAISPFIGLPVSWLNWLLPILGILITIFAAPLRNTHQIQSSE